MGALTFRKFAEFLKISTVGQGCGGGGGGGGGGVMVGQVCRYFLIFQPKGMFNLWLNLNESQPIYVAYHKQVYFHSSQPLTILVVSYISPLCYWSKRSFCSLKQAKLLP